MKILHIISNLSGGGAEKQFSYLASKLPERGYEIHVAYLNEGSFCFESAPSVKFHKINARNNYDPLILYRLIMLVLNYKPDIIHSWILQSDILAAVVSLITRTKWVVREPNTPFLRTRKGIKFFLRDKLVAFSSAIVANSYSGLKYWIKKYPKKQAYMIRNGFPVDAISDQCENSSCGSYASSRYIVFVGRLEHQKNVLTLIDSMKYVDPSVHLLLCGNGSLYARCEKRITDSSLQDRVLLLGSLSASCVYKLMQSAEALLLISHYEGFPNVVIEAMINKCPIIVSDIEPHREFLDETTAVFVDKNNEVDIACSIMRIINDTDAAEKLARNAFDMARMFTIDRMVCEYSSLYNTLINDQLK